LESLQLGHREWFDGRRAARGTEERTPLYNIASFCSLLPRLEKLELATLALRRIESPYLEWEDPGVSTVVVDQWIPTTTDQASRKKHIQFWFPSAEFVQLESGYPFPPWSR